MARIMNVEDAVDGDFAQRNIDRQINKGITLCYLANQNL